MDSTQFQQWKTMLLQEPDSALFEVLQHLQKECEELNANQAQLKQLKSMVPWKHDDVLTEEKFLCDDLLAQVIELKQAGSSQGFQGSREILIYQLAIEKIHFEMEKLDTQLRVAECETLQHFISWLDHQFPKFQGYKETTDTASLKKLAEALPQKKSENFSELYTLRELWQDLQSSLKKMQDLEIQLENLESMQALSNLEQSDLTHATTPLSANRSIKSPSTSERQKHDNLSAKSTQSKQLLIEKCRHTLEKYRILFFQLLAQQEGGQISNSSFRQECQSAQHVLDDLLRETLSCS